jgi:NDP-sugar pyrophosphorylase family protein
VDTGGYVRALILSAGYGTRLGDLTQATPKPMLSVKGRPILEYIIRNLAAQGIHEIAINLHFMPEVIQNYFGTGSRFGVEIVYSHEPKLLGTAGAVRRLGTFLGSADCFLVHYGDVLTDQNFTDMQQKHKTKKALASMLVHRRSSSNSVVSFNGEWRALSFLERPSSDAAPQGPYWVNSGVYLCSPALIELIPDHVPCDFPRDIFPKIVEAGQLFGYPLSAYRCAIDSAKRLSEAAAAIENGICRVVGCSLPPGRGAIETSRRAN